MGWDPSDEVDIKPEECEEVFQALEDVTVENSGMERGGDATGNKGI